MRINDILTESEVQNLEEGPLLNKIGAGIGKAVGTAGKAIGAVAGGVAGAADAAKKGFAAGRSAVAGAGDEDPNAPTSAADINAAGPKGTAAAKTQTGAGAQALAKTSQATQNATADQAGQTVYAQVKANINKLDKKGKQRIMQLLQKSVAAPAAKPAAGAAPASEEPPKNLQGKPLTEPERAAHQAAGGKFDGVTGDMLPIQQAKAAPKQQAAAPAADQQGTGQAAIAAANAGQDPEAAAKQAMAAKNPKLAGMMQQAGETPAEPAPKKKRASRKKAAPDQATIDADRDRLMGNFTDSVERHKQRMVAEGFANGTISIYKK